MPQNFSCTRFAAWLDEQRLLESGGTAKAPADYRELSFAGNGDLSGVRLRDGRSLSFGYDGLGHRATVTFVSPTGVSDATTTYGYDLLDRTVSVSDVAGQSVGYGYDALGRVVSMQMLARILGLGTEMAHTHRSHHTAGLLGKLVLDC